MALVVYQGAQNSDVEESQIESRKLFVGLTNQGATCYLNGLLQTLFMTPEFRKAIFSWSFNREKDGEEEFCIPLQLQKLFGLLQLSKSKAVDTVDLTRSFGWEGAEVFQQQDVQELTRVLFDALEVAFKGTNFENIIDELYAGELIDYIRCLDVDYESDRIDKFLDFSLAIVPFGSDKPMKTLTECIEFFLRPELLDGDNKYYSDKYQKKVDAIKGLKFGRLPQIMSIQLKRFVYDFSGPNIVQKKLNDEVMFPFFLDMNAYVAKQKRINSENQEEYIDNIDFEFFLQTQMEILQQNRMKSENGTQSESGATVNVGNNPFDNQNDPSVPSLVDITNEDADSLPELESNDTYNNLSNDEIQYLLDTKGEWIYELYAVLIHSGAATGGHYYANIKDLTSKQWYNFNDSNVTLISEATVREAWGGIKKPTYNSAYSYTSTYHSNYGSNAYMLMYRKVESTTNLPSNIPDDIVPEYIKKIVEIEEAKLEAKRIEEENYRNRLTVKVHFQGLEKFIHTKRNESYETLLNLIWNELKVWEYVDPSQLKNDETLHDDKVISNPPPNYDAFRLRDWNSYTKIISTAYDYLQSKNKTLQELNILDYKYYYLELRRPNEEWEVFLADGFSVIVEEFQSDTLKFKEPRSIRLQKTATLGDLKLELIKYSSIPMEKIRVFKIVNIGYYEAREELLEDDSKLLRDQYFIFDGAKLYFESLLESSLAFNTYIQSRNQISLNFNRLNESDFDLSVTVDGRWKVQDIRNKIAEILNIPVHNCRLIKHSNKGQELKDGDLFLNSLGFYNGINIFVMLGKITPPGYHVINLTEYFAKDHMVGIVNHPTSDNLPMNDPFQWITENNVDFGLPKDVNTENLDDDMLDNLSNQGVVDNDYDFNNDDYDDYDQMNAEPYKHQALDEDSFDNDLQARKYQGNNALNNFCFPNTLSSIDDIYPNFEDEDVAVATSASVVVDSTIEPDTTSEPVIAEPLDEKAIIDATISTELLSDLETLNLLCDDNVQPSDFAQKIIKNCIQLSQFEAFEAPDILVKNETTVDELRQMVTDSLISANRIPAGTSANHIRLRDRYGINPGKILRNGKTLQECSLYLSDQKTLAFQILDEEEDLPSEDFGDAVVLVQMWYRSTWSLSERIEYYLPGSLDIYDIATRLATMFNIPAHSLRVLIVPRECSLYYYELNQDSPSSNYGKSWFNPFEQDKKPLAQQPYDKKIHDNDLLIVQNIHEPLYTLSIQDLKSIQIVEASKSNAWSHSSIHYPTTSAATQVSTPPRYNSGTSAAVNWSDFNVNLKPIKLQAPGGIKIKTLKDRMKGEENMEKLSTASNTSDTSGNITPVDQTNTSTSPIQFFSDGPDEGTMDPEFMKAGGVTQFEDLI